MSAAASAPTGSLASTPLYRALQSSLTQNQMVEFSRYAQLATIGLDGAPACRSVRMRGGLLVDPQSGRGYLRFSTDARSQKIKEFAFAASKETPGKDGSNSLPPIELHWFFPVSREQYRLKCEVQLVFTPDASPEVQPTSPNTVASVTPDATPTGATASGDAASTELTAALRSIQRTDAASLEQHAQFWREHGHSRSLFELAPPGTMKRRVTERPGDLDQFEAQATSDERPSRNFVSVLLFPVRCDYLKLPRPEDDPRGRMRPVQHQQSKHESAMQPSRHQIRWLHKWTQEGGWTATELNP